VKIYAHVLPHHRNSSDYFDVYRLPAQHGTDLAWRDAAKRLVGAGVSPKQMLWGTYFCNIFNPAKLKISAMTSEMPKKYWKNLPEAQYIQDLIAGAEAKVQQMRDTAPTLPPERAAKIQKRLRDGGSKPE
jgi:hypothetical protein